MNKGQLFYNISEEQQSSMINCFKTTVKNFKSGEIISFYDENNLEIGIVESGSASVVHESLSGTRTILENLLEGDIFGALFYFHANRGNIFVEATKDCSVRFIDYDHLIKRCKNACAHHSQLVNNVLIMIQEKTKQVCEHLEVLSQRSIRDRLLCYFDILSRQNNSMTFEIPFTITNMADYLSVDRSAMSREIGKLKDEKILDLNRRKVTLLKTDLF